MLEAIHKDSKKKVTAFQIRTSLEWQSREREIFISPYDEVDNWEEQLLKGITECEVTFVKRHTRDIDGIIQPVSEHFRIVTEGFRENVITESEQHKLAKKYIYDNYENIILVNFDNKKLTEIANIKDIRIEKGIGEKRADVLVIFDKPHEVLGNGIAFEIQISPQNEMETIQRTFDRSAFGYSVCWLWSKDLRNFKNLVKVIPFNEALKEYNEQVLRNEEFRISMIAEKARLFNNELETEINKKVKQNKKILEDLTLIKEDNSEATKRILNEIFDKQKKEVLQIRDDFKKQINEELQIIRTNYIDELRKLVSETISNINLKEVIESMINNNIKNIVNKDNLVCYYCNSNDTHEYNDCYFCFNCKVKRYKDGKKD